MRAKAMDDWTYEPAPDLEQTVAERMRAFPRQPDMAVYVLRGVFQTSLRAILRAYNGFDVRGAENLPMDESFVMISNHSSHLDAICLLASLPLSRVHAAFPAAAADYFFASFPRTMFSAIAINGLPFDRTKGSGSLEICRELLAKPGRILILFPEGTRTLSGTPGRFRLGIARLVAGTKTPVVPCYLSGAYEAWPKGAFLPRPHPLRLHIGQPRRFANVTPGDRDAAVSICTQLRNDVLALSPERAPAYRTSFPVQAPIEFHR